MANIVEASQKTNIMKRFYRDIKLELKKVSWPTKKELIHFFIIVVITIITIGILVWIFDLVSNFIINRILK